MLHVRRAALAVTLLALALPAGASAADTATGTLQCKWADGSIQPVTITLTREAPGTPGTSAARQPYTGGAWKATYSTQALAHIQDGEPAGTIESLGAGLSAAGTVRSSGGATASTSVYGYAESAAISNPAPSTLSRSGYLGFTQPKDFPQDLGTQTLALTDATLSFYAHGSVGNGLPTLPSPQTDLDGEPFTPAYNVAFAVPCRAAQPIVLDAVTFLPTPPAYSAGRDADGSLLVRDVLLCTAASGAVSPPLNVRVSPVGGTFEAGQSRDASVSLTLPNLSFPRGTVTAWERGPYANNIAVAVGGVQGSVSLVGLPQAPSVTGSTTLSGVRVPATGPLVVTVGGITFITERGVTHDQLGMPATFGGDAISCNASAASYDVPLDAGPLPTPTPSTTPVPSSSPTPPPSPKPLIPFNYAIAGTTTLETLTKGTMPITGSITGTIELTNGIIGGTTTLNDTQGRLTALGFLPVTASIGFVTSGPTTGKLANAQLALNQKVRVKVKSVKAFGAIPLASGNTCQTKSLTDINLAGPFDPSNGGTLTGTYAISDLNGCGALNGLVSPLAAGSGNTLSLKLTPTA